MDHSFHSVDSAMLWVTEYLSMDRDSDDDCKMASTYRDGWNCFNWIETVYSETEMLDCSLPSS